MKRFPIVLLMVFSISCASHKYTLEKGPIYDIQGSYEQINAQRKVSRSIDKMNAQTVYAYQGKVISKEKLNTMMDHNKLKSIKVITNTTEIENLGFDKTKVRQLIWMQ